MDGNPALKAQVRIVRQDGIKRKFEEAVHRASSGIDCGNAGRSKNDIFLFRIAQIYRRNGGFTRTGFPVERRTAGYIG